MFTEDTLTHQESPYAKSKGMGGEMVKEYSDKYNMRVRHIRFFPMYGQAQDFKRDIPPAISFFLMNLINGDITPLRAMGEKSRDYIYIKDAIHCVNKIIDDVLDTTTSKYEIYNVGTGVSTKLKDVYKLCQSAAEVTGQSVFVKEDLWPDPAIYNIADTSKLRKLIGDYKFMELEKGLKLHYHWLSNEMRGNK
jgi:nucleoside-diphosphate-sugar epimerase